jgi:hypothetical protein
MEPGLTDTLCTRCGLCCDGSLFADVELAGRAEATRLEVLGLEIDDEDPKGALLSQPCRALRGRRCSIYPHRPGSCRTFECGLLQKVRHGTVGAERAGERIAETLKRIDRARKRMARLGRHDGRLPLGENCAGMIARDPHPVPQVNRERASLETEMSALEESLRQTFLDGSRRSLAHRAANRLDGNS